jgi:bifunctional ADP-heptose synthase (sugar kinase/adenylyltransferase)
LGREILQQTTAHQVVITEGPEGMSLFMGDGQYAHVPTYAQQVFDVTGAGDTVIATIALALASGEGLFQACQLANFAAGVVVAKYGCLPCTSQELITYMKKNGPFS